MFFPKGRGDKSRKATLTTIQHLTDSQCLKWEREEYTNWKLRNKTILIQRWYDCLCRKFQRFKGSYSWVKQDCKIKSKYVGVSK